MARNPALVFQSALKGRGIFEIDGPLNEDGVAWGGEDLIDVMDMVVRLREHRPGDVVQMVVLRDGEEIELDITMKASNRAMEN